MHDCFMAKMKKKMDNETRKGQFIYFPRDSRGEIVDIDNEKADKSDREADGGNGDPADYWSIKSDKNHNILLFQLGQSEASSSLQGKNEFESVEDFSSDEESEVGDENNDFVYYSCKLRQNMKAPNVSCRDKGVNGIRKTGAKELKKYRRSILGLL